jgi:hypothetical protein
VTVGQVPGNLLLRRIDNRDTALHESLERRVAESSAQRKNLDHALFLQRLCQQLAATHFHCTSCIGLPTI